MDKKLRRKIKKVIEALEEDLAYFESDNAMENYELAEYARSHVHTTLCIAESALEKVLKEYG